jgi:hypothetical protein
MKNKKGQIFENIGSLAVGIGSLAVTLVVAFLILAQGVTQSTELTTATTFTNETVSLPNATTTVITKCVSNEDLTVVQMYNDSLETGVVLASGNYTVTKNAIAVNLQTAIAGLSPKNVTYTCKLQSEAYNATVTMQNATQEVPDWIPLVVVVVIGGILLSLVAVLRNR